MSEVSPEVMVEMRNWVAECEWGEAQEGGMSSREYVDGLSDEEVLSGVEQHYSGGIATFHEAIGATPAPEV